MVDSTRNIEPTNVGTEMIGKQEEINSAQVCLPVSCFPGICWCCLANKICKSTRADCLEICPH